jgi:MoaA/NifB/PqqE/SkfB family radical SAM enzyme/precorrin-6B methylase 2
VSSLETSSASSQSGSDAPAKNVDTAVADAISKIETAIHNLRTAAPRLGVAEFLSLVDGEQKTIRTALGVRYAADFAGLLALKVSNLAVARYHAMHRHTSVASGPIQLMVDPANSCPLSCPGCVHTGNPDLKARYDWPGGLLRTECFEEFIRLYGPTAFGVVFYNYGEPMLNKRTPNLIRSAKRYFLHTCLSSNFTVPFDAESVVDSGLNCIFASLDGATQETFATYRRGGNLETCFTNIRMLVEAKQRKGSRTPYVEWKFLTFEHNLHEVDLAVETGRKLGVDEVNIAEPFAVDWDDPSIRVAETSRHGRVRFSDGQLKGPLDHHSSFEDPDGVVEEAVALSWVERGERAGALDQEAKPGGTTCRWLYQSMTIDAKKRIHPCCMPPEHGLNRVYGVFGGVDAEGFNNAWLSASRTSFADSSAFEAEIARDLEGTRPYCADCDADPELTYTVDRDVRRDLALLDDEALLTHASLDWLTQWGNGGDASADSLQRSSMVVKRAERATHLLLVEEPKFHVDEHGNPASWGIEPALIEALPTWVSSGDRTIETGAGLSTVMFCAIGSRHTAVSPDGAEFERIRRFCEGHEISIDGLNAIVGRSDRILPAIEETHDLALIDGCHGFPSVYLDWYYLVDRLVVGGLLVVNATALYTVRTLVDFMSEDPSWEMVAEFDGSAAFRKLVHGGHTSEWNQQPFVESRSR